MIYNFLSTTENEEALTLGEKLKEAIFPEDVSFFGFGVNPSFFSALIVTGFLIVCALLIRIFVIPRFKMVPGKFQVCLEKLVSFFSDMAESNSPHKNEFLGAYIFSAGLFIFCGTLIEILGFRPVLVDLNACLVLGLMSFLVIMGGGFSVNKFKGGLKTLKDFSLPISMTFRLFGSMLSGLLVTELVYQYIFLSLVVPVIVGIIFTLVHAIIQTYILTLLTSIFYGEAAEPPKLKLPKTKKKKKIKSEPNGQLA